MRCDLVPEACLARWRVMRVVLGFLQGTGA